MNMRTRLEEWAAGPTDLATHNLLLDLILKIEELQNVVLSTSQSEEAEQPNGSAEQNSECVHEWQNLHIRRPQAGIWQGWPTKNTIDWCDCGALSFYGRILVPTGQLKQS